MKLLQNESNYQQFDQIYRSRMVRSIAIVELIACVCMLIYGLFDTVQFPIVFYSILLPIVLIQFMTLYLERIGHLFVASLLTILPAWLGLLFGYLFRPDLLIMMMIPIILTGLLLNIRVMVGVTIVTILYVILLQYIEHPILDSLVAEDDIRFFAFAVTFGFGLSMVILQHHLQKMREAQNENLRLQIAIEQQALYQKLTENMAHDFRTPLTNIINQSYLIRQYIDKGLDAAPKLDALDKHLVSLKNMLEDIHRLNDLQSYQSESQTQQSVDVAKLLDDSIQKHTQFASDKNISIHREALDEALFVTGDDKQLNMLFDSLVKNAIQYGKQDGHVEIMTTHDSNKVTIDVKDDGIGIAEEHHAKIFERFYRVNTARTIDEHTGTGIGLTIAEYIAQIHNGTIQVESTSDEGSRFRVTLPK